MKSRGEILTTLSELDIPHEIVEHQAVYTVDEVVQLGLMEVGLVCKNLFLRDAKGKSHYLIVLSPDKKADLKNIQLNLDSTKLGFASEERLQSFLGLKKGAVTPLGIINDENHSVTVVFDQDLLGKEKLGVHPEDNTATVWISFDGLRKYISHFGNEIRYIEI